MKIWKILNKGDFLYIYISVQTSISSRRCDSFGGRKLQRLHHPTREIPFIFVLCGNNSTLGTNVAFYSQSCG